LTSCESVNKKGHLSEMEVKDLRKVKRDKQKLFEQQCGDLEVKIRET